ncbi:MAG: NAD(P)/FAD-dependent oxidoreductase [Alphaproteobacteria bacterium]|nr:NAD(P)/FAD-dependent oxidoreductase [Alphaproteobacteria bacterium]
MEHFDVLIIGAGISGIDAGYHLNKFAPKKSYVILENRERIGGTWDLFRYPGIRSDSDMLTMGYHFKPWTHESTISPGDKIRDYVTETARENGIDKHIRFRHNVKSVSWDSKTARWTVEGTRRDASGKETPVTLTANFLFSCAGYYRYSEGYTPEFKGRENFKGTIIHPQRWPENFDYRAKRVVIIGSGATAVTLLPNMAKSAAHVTMLQRSPTYYVSRPEKDKMANTLRKFLPASWAYMIPRWRNIVLQRFFFGLARKKPQQTAERLIKGVSDLLPKDYDVKTHFTPSYNPWDQRVCLVPDADMFNAISEGKASVVTDHIESFTAKGIKLKSGKELEADVIVTATGLHVQMLGGAQITVDGAPVDPGKSFAYKGMMLSNVPNLAFVFGYTNASWTLRADLVCEWVTRVLNKMDEKGTPIVTARPTDPNMKADPMLDFSSGYVQRALAVTPKQGPEAPWRQNQNYFTDLKEMRKAPIEDGVLQFAKAGAAAKPTLARAAE